MKKTVLVTGSSRGIGRAVALKFASCGYRIVINCARSTDRLEEVKKEVEALGAECLAVQADVGNPDDCKRLFKEIESRFDHVDVLVNNAGISIIGLLQDLSFEDWNRILSANLSSVFHCTKLAIPGMIHNHSGKIINISSVWGVCGASCEAAYSATKGGVNGLTMALAKELAPSGIQVNAIACGAIDTEMNHFLDDEEREKLGRFILRANGTMNPEIVGRSVKTIANLAGLEKVPATARVLVAKETGVGRGHPYSNEKLGPILAFYTAENYEKVCEKVCEILHYEGAGHTFSMHTNDDKMVDYFARRVPASRVMVNTPSALGGIGGTTALQPALTLGCGAVGGSATSENVGPMHLLNLRYVAYGLKELDEIRASVPDCSDGVCRTAPSLENIDVDDIVRQIIGKLQKL